MSFISFSEESSINFSSWDLWSFETSSQLPMSMLKYLFSRIEYVAKRWNHTFDQNEQEIQKTLLKVGAQVESYRDKIQKNLPLFSRLLNFATEDEKGTFVLEAPYISLNEQGGVSSSYFALDQHGNRQFVLKPIDEDAGCINNRSGYAALGSASSFFRDAMPAYRSSIKEAFTYEMSKEVGLEKIAPETAIAIFRSSEFSYFHKSWDLTSPILNSILGKERVEKLRELLGFETKDKLCSIQAFVRNAKAFGDLWGKTFDQEQYELINTLIWLTYDTDAHQYNILSGALREESDGSFVYGFKKIDNGLTFPTKNVGLRNSLVYLDLAQKPLSEKTCELIEKININSLTEKMKDYGLEEEVEAFVERVTLLKELVQDRSLTIWDINEKLDGLGDKHANFINWG